MPLSADQATLQTWQAEQEHKLTDAGLLTFAKISLCPTAPMDFSVPKKNARADVSVCRAFLSGLD
jgi:hypothetical protein